MNRLVAGLFAGTAICVAGCLVLFLFAYRQSESLASCGGYHPIASCLGNSTLTSLLSAYVAAASFLAATGGWLFSNGVTLHTKLREKASDFLKSAQEDTKLLAALLYISKVANRPENVIALQGSADREAFYISAEGEQFFLQLRIAMNFFEELAIFIKRGAADEQLLRDFYIGMLCRLYDIYVPYASLLKNVPRITGHSFGTRQRPDLYVNVDWLHDRWSRRYSAEFFHGRHSSEIELTGLDVF